MKKQTVIDYFKGTSQVARFLNISPAAVSVWPDPIPKGRAYELEKLTNGNLKFDPSLYESGIPSTDNRTAA